MAKVFGIHQLELHPGVKAEDFEQFFREVASQVPKAGADICFAATVARVRAGSQG